MEELKPCPFCGGSVKTEIIELADRKREITVWCKPCDYNIVFWHKNIKDAIAAWNRRAEVEKITDNDTQGKEITEWR
jgi:Lar family restriction alleviation protein